MNIIKVNTDGEFAGFTKGAYTTATLLIATLVLCFSSVRTVGAGEVGIVTRFGEVNRIAASGLVVKIPFIEKLEIMEIRVQKEEQSATAATKDLQDVQVSLALNYALDNNTALRVYKELGKDYKSRVVTPAVQESFKAAASNYTAQELVTERATVKQRAFDVIKSRLDKYGIRVVDLNIVNFSFSADFSTAIESVQVASQKVAQARQELEKTKIDAETAIEKARGQAESQRLQIQTLTPELLQKMAIEKWDGKLPTTQAGENMFIGVTK